MSGKSSVAARQLTRERHEFVGLVPSRKRLKQSTLTIEFHLYRFTDRLDIWMIYELLQ